MADREPTGLWLAEAFFGFLAAIFLVLVLKELRQIFIPFFIALFFYFMFRPMVRRLERRRLPKALILVGVLLFVVCCLFLLGVLIFNGAASFVDRVPVYSGKISRMFQDALASLKLPVIDVNRYIAGIDWEKAIDPGKVTAVVSGTVGSFTSLFGNLLLVVLLLMFMLGEKVPMAARIAQALPSRRSDELRAIMADISARVHHYLFIKTLMSLATAVLAAMILLVGGVDLVVFSSLLVFFLNYIPTFGSLASTAFPVLIAFLKYGFCLRLVLIAAALMVMQFVMGNVIEPQIMGRSLNLSPIVILLSLIFWGWLWGVVGMFLAVPVTAALKIFLDHVPALKPLSAALSDE
jgi:predicted PurR-regulated permease PerM